MRSEATLYTIPYTDYTDDELRRCKDGIAKDELDRRERGVSHIDATEVRNLIVNIGVSDLRMEGVLNVDDYASATLIFTLTDGRQLRIVGYEGLLAELIERPSGS